jgi:hypothetical protein
LKLSKNPPLRISAAEKAPVYAGSGNEIFKNGGFSTASLGGTVTAYLHPS